MFEIIKTEEVINTAINKNLLWCLTDVRMYIGKMLYFRIINVFLFGLAYRDVFRSINQHNLEPKFVGLLYCQFRHDGMSNENSIKEVNVGKLKNKMGNWEHI